MASKAELSLDTQQAATKRAEGEDKPGSLPARWADTGSPVAADERPELSPAIAPLLAKIALDESIPVTYTTRSGEVFTTLKPLRPMPSLVLSHHPEAPTHNVAMVGFPQLGADLIRTLALNEGCFVTFIVEDNADRMKAAKDQIGEMHLERIRVIGSSEFSQVLSSDVKMVYFCGPSLGKAGMVRALLAAHKSVMCDKPLSPSIAETKELFSAARATGKVLMINLPGRPGKAFAPTVMSLLSSASRTVVERVVNSSFTLAPRRRIDPQDKAVEALFLNVAMHDCFAVNFSICMRPLSVKVKLLPGDEVAEAEYVYANQCVLVVRCDPTLIEHETQKFTLSGDRLQEMRRVDHMERVASGVTAHPNDNTSVRFTQNYDEAQRDALEQFYAAISGAKALAPRVRPQLMEQNVLDCLKIAQASVEALRSGELVDITYW